MSSGNPRHDWTVKGSGGDQFGALFLMDRDHQNQQANLASGHMAGSVGHLPSRTLTSGRCLYCQARRLLVGRTFALTPVGTLAPLSHAHQQQGSTQCHPTCSACCSWSGCNSRFLWQRRCAKVVMPLWGTTEQRCSRTGRLKHPQSAPERGVPAADGRRIEVLAQDLPLFGVSNWLRTSHCGAF